MDPIKNELSINELLEPEPCLSSLLYAVPLRFGISKYGNNRRHKTDIFYKFQWNRLIMTIYDSYNEIFTVII